MARASLQGSRAEGLPQEMHTLRCPKVPRCTFGSMNYQSELLCWEKAASIHGGPSGKLQSFSVTYGSVGILILDEETQYSPIQDEKPNSTLPTLVLGLVLCIICLVFSFIFVVFTSCTLHVLYYLVYIGMEVIEWMNCMGNKTSKL